MKRFLKYYHSREFDFAITNSYVNGQFSCINVGFITETKYASAKYSIGEEVLALCVEWTDLNVSTSALNIFKKSFRTNKRDKGEFYIAPLYNELISQGKIIKYFKIKIDEIIFCGTPQEYEKLIKR